MRLCLSLMKKTFIQAKKLIDRIEIFRRRLERIGIDITFSANYPWIYFDTINGKEVEGVFAADHGWTAFFYPVNIGGKIKFSDRREVFKKVRSML